MDYYYFLRTRVFQFCFENLEQKLKNSIFTPAVFSIVLSKLRAKTKNNIIFFRLTVFPFLLSKLSAKTKNNL